MTAEDGQTVLHDGKRVKLIADDAQGRLLIRIDGQDAVYIDVGGIRKARKGEAPVGVPINHPVASGHEN